MTKSDDGTFHGGFVRDRGEGRGVRVAHSKTSELPVPDSRMAQERVSAMMASDWRGEVVKPLKARRTALACLGIPSHILDKGNQEYARCVRLSNSYKKARVKEFYAAHGFVSSGVSALLAAASLALSASRYLYEVASDTPFQPERGNLGQPQILKLASSLSDSARQNELSAWELCAREAVVRKRNDNNNAALPWVTGSPAGDVRRGPGRPRKLTLLQETNNAGAILDGETESSSTEGGRQD